MHTHTQMRSKLEAAGGKVLEDVQLSGVDVYADGVALSLASQTLPGGASSSSSGNGSSGGSAAGGGGAQQGGRVQYGSTVTGRLLLDCMGHASPIVKQLR